jgi:hypothetical protein
MLGQVEFHLPEILVSMSLVEAGSLKAAGLHDCPLAPAPSSFLFNCLKQSDALRLPSDLFGKIRHVQKQEAEFRSALKAAQYLA